MTQAKEEAKFEAAKAPGVPGVGFSLLQKDVENWKTLMVPLEK